MGSGCDCSRLGHFYLCVPGSLGVGGGPGFRRVISLDPGIRRFMTGYTPDGEVVALGKGDIGHIYRLWHGLDHRKKWRMRRAGFTSRILCFPTAFLFFRRISLRACTNGSSFLRENLYICERATSRWACSVH
ncbi:hypothetical protein V1515DRAFT_605035 [Lipomyces mesembrius]